MLGVGGGNQQPPPFFFKLPLFTLQVRRKSNAVSKILLRHQNKEM